MVIKDGRFGPYVTDGETNASLRKGDEVDTITVERSAELLAERRARGPAPKRVTKKPAAPKKAADQGLHDQGRPPAKKPAARADRSDQDGNQGNDQDAGGSEEGR